MKTREQYNQYQKVYQLNRYHRRRNTAIVYLGGQCVVCGATENLEIDHKDFNEKSFSLAKLWSINEIDYLIELSKCQLLCKKHHIEKSQQEDKERRPITHGKHWAAIHHKCCCDLCKEYKANNNKKRREKRKALSLLKQSASVGKR